MPAYADHAQPGLGHAMTATATQSPHRRFNPLTGSWVLVSPQRTQRPWLGEVAADSVATVSRHDPNCYLCAGATRANGTMNPHYSGPYVFGNDFPAMRPEDPTDSPAGDALFRWQPARGEARVLCFSERHDLTLARLDHSGRVAVVKAWIEQFRDLGARFDWVAVFENKGTMMGCSNPHPHGQIWASNHIPTEIAREDNHQLDYYRKNGSVLLCDYASAEQSNGERVVAENKHWISIVPWWAIWPFETLLIPKRNVQTLEELEVREIEALAQILGHQTTQYDNLFKTDFPYSMGWHSAPPGVAKSGHWQLHAHFYPPLLRSAQVRKFMVGYELLAEAQRDLTPESAAASLRAVAGDHYGMSHEGRERAGS